MRVMQRAVFPILALFVAAQLAAQDSDAVRAAQIRKLELERSMLLKMIDSMPAQYFHERVTEPQRDFAQQLYHVASIAVFFAERYMTSEVPAVPDEEKALASPEALKVYIEAAYDYAVRACRNQSQADRDTVVEFFARRMPKWLIWDELHQHSLWTAGQVVANFRKHGMPPPEFLYF